MAIDHGDVRGSGSDERRWKKVIGDGERRWGCWWGWQRSRRRWKEVIGDGDRRWRCWWGWQAMAAVVATAIGVSQDGGVKGVVVTMVMKK